MNTKTYINSRSLKAPSREINRRDFLWLSSAFSLGLFSSVAIKSYQFSASNNLIIEAKTEKFASDFLSLGFWDVSKVRDSKKPETMVFKNVENRDIFTSNIVSANNLKTGDLGFLEKGARIKIQPVYPYIWENTGLRSLTANVHYQPKELQQDVKTCAWYFASTPILNVGAPTSFVVPVNQQGLKLSFDLESSLDNSRDNLLSLHKKDKKKTNTEEVLLHLSLDQENNSPKLKRGIYIVAGKSNSTGKLPVWHQYELGIDHDHSTIKQPSLFRFDQRQNKVVLADFPYLLISVDYGSVNFSNIE